MVLSYMRAIQGSPGAHHRVISSQYSTLDQEVRSGGEGRERYEHGSASKSRILKRCAHAYAQGTLQLWTMSRCPPQIVPVEAQRQEYSERRGWNQCVLEDMYSIGTLYKGTTSANYEEWQAIVILLWETLYVSIWRRTGPQVDLFRNQSTPLCHIPCALQL